jgi:RND family efflux transporter MFP subunit
MLAQQRAGSGPLGGMFTKHGVLFGGEDLPPLFVGLGHGILFCLHSDQSSYDMARWLIVIAALLTAGACRREAPRAVEQEEVLIPVGAVPAQRAAIRAVIHASGLVVPAEGGEFLVVAPEPTRLVDVMKMPGDTVKSGDVLARFDLPSAAQAIARLAADLAAAQAQAENARVNQERMRGFAERGLIPRRDLETADRDLATAQDAAERARTAHAAAQAAATRATIRAPFDGIVAARTHNPGDMIISTSDPVLRVVDPKRLEIVASIPRQEQSRVVTGASARVATGGTDMVRLTVAGRAAVPTGLSAGSFAQAGVTKPESSDDTVPFRLVFADPHMLTVDMPVQLDIDAEERADTVLVPAEAIVRDNGEKVVFVAAGSRAERRSVKTGIEDAARVEIIDGLKAGELVITRGQVGLTDGAAVTVATGR